MERSFVIHNRIAELLKKYIVNLCTDRERRRDRSCSLKVLYDKAYRILEVLYVQVETTCAYSAKTTDHISLRFSDTKGNLIILKHLKNPKLIIAPKNGRRWVPEMQHRHV
ncbi:hypothetical protein Ddye_028614 [Dipteronia dyeriana]|uniref:Uncharacterized protein n=1 Tax=Dipteronia dyeriana TaxID=168575 RepID=A0AAD9TDM3_9ROSI|nr:hypothetical protein Ddye_028614 [Dipteronia dyeriana]